MRLRWSQSFVVRRCNPLVVNLPLPREKQAAVKGGGGAGVNEPVFHCPRIPSQPAGATCCPCPLCHFGVEFRSTAGLTGVRPASAECGRTASRELLLERQVDRELHARRVAAHVAAQPQPAAEVADPSNWWSPMPGTASATPSLSHQPRPSGLDTCACTRNVVPASSSATRRNQVARLFPPGSDALRASLAQPHSMGSVSNALPVGLVLRDHLQTLAPPTTRRSILRTAGAVGSQENVGFIQ